MGLFFVGMAIGIWLGLIFRTILEIVEIMKKAVLLKLECSDDDLEDIGEPNDEPFTYDCLNDPDPDDTDIPKLY